MIAVPVNVSFLMPDWNVIDTVRPTIAASLFSGVPVAGSKSAHDADHFFLPEMNVRHVPVEDDDVSMTSSSMLISHDLAPAIAVPLSFIIRFLPCITSIVVNELLHIRLALSFGHCC